MAGKMAYLSKEEKQKIRNALKIKKSLDKEEDHHNLRASSPESEDVDFKKVIHPLSYYIHDREQMSEEMFSIINGDKLRKMLPPLLKNYTLEEIKADCLVHLLGMSKKRILAIIEGRELYSSSDSESESSTTTSEPEEKPKSPNNKIESRSNIDDEDLLDISISEKDIDSLMKDKPKAANKSKKPRSSMRKKIKTEKDVSLFSIVISDDDLDDPSKKAKKTNRERASNKLDKILGNKEKGKKRRKTATHSKSNANASTEGNASQKPNNAASLDENDKGKTLLEILELEMRARAIRALLKNTNDVEEGSSALEAVKSTTDAAAKSDPKIVSAIAEAIDQSLSDKAVEPNDDSDLDDVEIIDDIDLCVLIDDDDDMETNSEVAAPQTQAQTCDPLPNDAEKKSVDGDGAEKSAPSNEGDANENEHTKGDSEKRKHSINDFEQSKPANDSEKSKPTSDSERSKPTSDSEKSKPASISEKSSKDNLENKSSKNDSEKSKLANNLEKSKPSTDDPEKRKLSEDTEARKPLPDDSKKRKLSKNDSGKSKPSTDISEKSKPTEDPEKNKPLNSEKSAPSEDKGCEKLKSSPSSEKTESSKESTSKKCESPKECDFQVDVDKCDLTKDTASEHSEDPTTSTDNVTWSERWAEKQNVKEVVRNSKICANIRKRMRFARMLKQKQSEENKQKADEIDMGNVDESSVAHYNLIKAHTSKNVECSDDSKTADKLSAAAVETSQDALETDNDITTADHTLTIEEPDLKSLIIDISDDET